MSLRVYVATLTSIACSSPPLEVRRNQRPSDGTCELRQEPTGQSLTSGTFDLALGDRASYLLTPVVENHEGEALTVRAVRIQVHRDTPEGRQRVRIRCEGDVACEEWEEDLCALGECPRIAAGSTASFEVPALPRDVTGYYQGEMDFAVSEGRAPPEYSLVAELRLVADGASGTVESDGFSYPIRLCLGCLVEYPPGSDSPALAGPDCCGDAPSEPACQPGQDGPISCADCRVSSPEICNFGRLTCAG